MLGLGLFILQLVFGNVVQAQNVRRINVLHTNEVGNHIANNALEVAIAYITRNSRLNLEVDLITIEANRTDSNTFLDSICAQYNTSLANGRKPHLIFDTTMTGLSSETVKSLSAALALPTVSATFGQHGDLRQWRNNTAQMDEYLLQVMPPGDIIPEVVRFIVEYMNITNAAILYDESFVMDHKYKALLQNIPTRHVITAIAPVARRQQQIEKLRNLDINNFFILGSIATIKGVLEAAKVEYFERNFAWYAITQESGDLRCQCENATVIFLKPKRNVAHSDRLTLLRDVYNLTMEPEVTSMFYFDLALYSFLAIRDMLQSDAFPADAEYITCQQFDGSNTPARSIDLKTFLMAVTAETAYGDFLWPRSSGDPPTPFNGNSYMVFDMDIRVDYMVKGSTMETKALGTWAAGLNMPMDIDEPQTMRGLSAATIYRVETVLQAPFIMRDPTAPKGFKGYCIDLLDQIAEILHFDYTIVENEEGRFGNMNADGEWNGVVRSLIDKKADISLGAMSVMAERETVIDFTVPYYDLVGITIMMILPSTPSSLFKFLTVLETNVWLCILAAYFFTSFLLWMFDRWSPYSYQNNREKYKNDEEKREFNIKECLWFCMTSLTPQGGGEAPKNLSGRLVAATWWLFGFIIIASYTANLAAFLTVSRLDVPVESLDGLSKQYKILYAPINGSTVMMYFERMAAIEGRFYEIWKDMSLNDSLSPFERSQLAVWNYPVSDTYTKMWQAIQEAGMPNTFEEAVERVRNSTSNTGFAFLGDATDIRYLVMTNCDLQSVGDEFSRKPYALAVQQGSALKEQFNNAILMLLNKRQLEKLKEDWWQGDEYQSKCNKPEDQSDGISIQNIGGVFIVIFVGIGMACITLVFEYWYYKNRRNPRIVDVAAASTTTADKKAMRMMAAVTGKSKLSPRNKDDQTMKNTALRARLTMPLPKPSFKFQI